MMTAASPPPSSLPPDDASAKRAQPDAAEAPEAKKPAVDAENAPAQTTGNGGAAQATDDAATPAGDAPAQPPAAEDDAKLEILLARLAEAMRDDRKLVKACGILAKALETDFTAQHAPRFMPLLEALAQRLDAGPAAAATGRPSTEIPQAIHDVFAQLNTPAKLEAVPKELALRVQTWLLRAVTLPDMRTDDSFRFAAASKKVVAAVQELDALLQRHRQQEEDGTPIVNAALRQQASEADKAHRVHVLLDIYEAMLTLGRRVWCKPTADHMFDQIVKRRLLLQGEQRDRLDDITNAWRNRRTLQSLSVKRSADKPYANFSEK